MSELSREEFEKCWDNLPLQIRARANRYRLAQAIWEAAGTFHAVASGEAWIPVEDKLPPAELGEAGQPPFVSDDVLVYFPGAMELTVEIANYDHETKRWSLVTHGFKEPDCDPTHWQPLPAAPEICQCEPPKSANDLGYVCPVHPVRDNKCKCICHQHGARFCGDCEINHADSRPSENKGRCQQTVRVGICGQLELHPFHPKQHTFVSAK